MVHPSPATTALRYLNLVRRAIEVTVVLFLAFVTTIFTICFGWVAQLFKSSPGANRVPANAVAFGSAEASKEY